MLKRNIIPGILAALAVALVLPGCGVRDAGGLAPQAQAALSAPLNSNGGFTLSL